MEEGPARAKVLKVHQQHHNVAPSPLPTPSLGEDAVSLGTQVWLRAKARGCALDCLRGCLAGGAPCASLAYISHLACPVLLGRVWGSVGRV